MLVLAIDIFMNFFLSCRHFSGIVKNMNQEAAKINYVYTEYGCSDCKDLNPALQRLIKHSHEPLEYAPKCTTSV